MVSASTLFAQAKSTKAKDLPVSGPIELALQPDVFRGHVKSFPRVLPGPDIGSDIVEKINASLARGDQRVRSTAMDCRKSSKEAQGKSDPGAWEREISVTMRGPRFLAFRVTDNYYCGGTYPSFGMETSFIYDLTLGTPVNWLKWLPPEVKGYLDTASDGSQVGLVKWPALLTLSRNQADNECKDVFKAEEGVAYSLNVDARAGTLDARPATFPHVIQACADTVPLDLSTLRKLGVSSDLIDVLESAHALQHAAKTAPRLK